jgi:hypothetical protein
MPVKYKTWELTSAEQTKFQEWMNRILTGHTGTRDVRNQHINWSPLSKPLNDGYPASLEPRKIYPVLPDTEAAAHQLLRIIDESGENYLYPADYFIPIDLPKAAEEAFSFVI